ncbi:MAG: hypothetical protein EA401_07435 [Planctomycetota bacterium]|nr:MAG: hypothetical protein EA401_07435 [Planctomycetota bacterium]
MPALLSFAQGVREHSGLSRIGIDLRLGSQAIAEADLTSCRQWRDRFAAAGLAFTSLNAFPLRPFQADVVKDQAYAPDWGTRQRLEESIACIAIADALSAEDATWCSISTLPGSYRPWGDACPSPALIAHNLGLWAAAAAQYHQQGGKVCVLCIEPEPCCSFGSGAEWAEFWRHQRQAAIAAAQTILGSIQAAEHAITQHLATCWDTCHASVMHEDQAATIQHLSSIGLPPRKVQMSAAPMTREPIEAAAIAALIGMDEPRFYHQVGLRWQRQGRRQVEILPDLCHLAQRWQDWQGRVPEGLMHICCHFHIPIDGSSPHPLLGSSIHHSREGLAAALQHGAQHISVETYTWSLLASSTADRIQGTARELQTLAALLP